MTTATSPKAKIGRFLSNPWVLAVLFSLLAAFVVVEGMSVTTEPALVYKNF